LYFVLLVCTAECEAAMTLCTARTDVCCIPWVVNITQWYQSCTDNSTQYSTVSSFVQWLVCQYLCL